MNATIKATDIIPTNIPIIKLLGVTKDSTGDGVGGGNVDKDGAIGADVVGGNVVRGTVASGAVAGGTVVEEVGF
jgi:hypothetical protein